MRFATVASLVAIGATIALPAWAYDGQSGMRAGIGIEQWLESETYTAPVATLGTGYGMSDWLDLRAAASASRYSFCDSGAPCGDQTWHLAAKSALAFKLDIIEWVPYAGPVFGFHGLLGGPKPSGAHSPDASAGALVGVDYSPTRYFGLGLQFDFRVFLAGAPDRLGDAAQWSAIVHAEHRWGW